MSVDTFEWTRGALKRFSHSPDLKAASASLPDGVYTTLRTYGGRRIVMLGQHAARLAESSALKGSPGALPLDTLRDAVSATLNATGHAESRLRLTFAPPRLLISVEPFSPLPRHLYEQGVSCVTVPVRRSNPHSKDTRFIATAEASYGALPPGIEEGLMVDEAGAVLEGLSSNFFALRDGRLWTEAERVLMGVTRSLVLQVAAVVVPVELKAIAFDESVQECFITSVSREVLPVVRIDGRPVGDGKPGPITREIAWRFEPLAIGLSERL
jgi:branched-chain amino acid aminotransferase